MIVRTDELLEGGHAREGRGKRMKKVEDLGVGSRRGEPEVHVGKGRVRGEIGKVGEKK